jgi:hypothetical protein
MAKIVESYVTGLNEVLRAFRNLPKEAGQELRLASVQIADRHMVPAWRDAAMKHAGPWGEAIAGSVRAKRDRVPSVSIGFQKRAVRGGASSNMLRYPADKGTRGRAGQRAAVFGKGGDWIEQVRPYQADALREWGQAVDAIVRKWDTTP